jgi:hypothetical protein
MLCSSCGWSNEAINKHASKQQPSRSQPGHVQHQEQRHKKRDQGYGQDQVPQHCDQQPELSELKNPPSAILWAIDPKISERELNLSKQR